MGCRRRGRRRLLMADVWSKKKRSAVMSLIRSRGNQETELRLIEIMRACGIRGWRRGQALPGRPDFVFRRERLAIFVDGCFWHGCKRCYRRPSSNQKYWDAKIEGNRARDRKVTRRLRMEGWSVIRIWHHDLNARRQRHTARRIQRMLESIGPASESSALANSVRI
jgi:DNA mismatch endonuclease, patch repair protein